LVAAMGEFCGPGRCDLRGRQLLAALHHLFHGQERPV